jgi:metal-responsive CopG/Arc/MetJ family transcriptional regulator
MKYAKVAISIEESVLKKIDRLVKAKTFESRSQAFQKAAEHTLERVERSQLAKECAKLDKRSERELADEGLGKAGKTPPYCESGS